MWKNGWLRITSNRPLNSKSYLICSTVVFLFLNVKHLTMFASLLFDSLLHSLRFYAALWNSMISLAEVKNIQYTLFGILCQLLNSELEMSNFQVELFLSIWIKFIINTIFLENLSPICGTIGLIQPLVLSEPNMQNWFKITDKELYSYFSLLIIMWNNNCRFRISFQLQMPGVFNVKIITKFEIQCWIGFKSNFSFVNRLEIWIQ